jgi:hypothetical protein
VRNEAAEVMSRMQTRVDAIGARAAALRVLSSRQANALGVAALAAKQASATIEKVKLTMVRNKKKMRVQLVIKHRVEIDLSDPPPVLSVPLSLSIGATSF